MVGLRPTPQTLAWRRSPRCAPQHYWSVIFLGDLSDPKGVQCIAELRQRAPRTWILMIGSTELRDKRALYLGYSVDAQIVTPFTMEDLISRLMAFSWHSRPA